MKECLNNMLSMVIPAKYPSGVIPAKAHCCPE